MLICLKVYYFLLHDCHRFSELSPQTPSPDKILDPPLTKPTPIELLQTNTTKFMSDITPYDQASAHS